MCHNIISIDNEMTPGLKMVPMNKYSYLVGFPLTDDAYHNSVLVPAIPCLGRGDSKSLFGDRRARDHFTQYDPPFNDGLF